MSRYFRYNANSLLSELSWNLSRGLSTFYCIVKFYKAKGSRSECSNYRGISLLSVPGIVYGKILTERLMEITERKVSEEQGGFRKGRGCIDQIFAMKRLVEEYLGKDKKLYAASIYD